MRDAGYNATDIVLQELQHNEQCKWLGVTNADNIYGAMVFERVLAATLPPQLDGQIDTEEWNLPDVIFAPMDSRNFVENGEFNVLLFVDVKL